ncbi:MAG: GNAT family N-acetyltransferase [Paucibacter sp.]|nr:GNAT family N-acetyltransferase [Roseateles sp.]
MTTPRLQWNHLPAAALANGSEHRRDWDALNSQRGAWPFLDAAAVALALTEFGTGQERLLIGRDGAQVRAMFVLAPQGPLRWQTFQPSQLPLGCWAAAEGLDLADLSRQLLRGPLGLCLAVTVTQIDPQMATRGDDAADTEHVDYIETGWVTLQADFESYWAARGKNLRQNVRKQHNRLSAAGRITEMRTLTRRADMARAIEEYGRLESAGWKAGGGTAIQAGNAQGRFYLALLEQAADRGEALVYQYLFDGRIVATDLCLRRDDVMTILKTTYDEAEHANSPATLLREEQMRHCFDTGLQRLEYFGRYMEWHSRWTDTKRTLYHLGVFRWAWLKRLARARRSVPNAEPAAAMETS